MTPRAIADGRIIDSEISPEQATWAKDTFYTRTGDVILKLATPYDCAFIDSAHEGILVTSFAAILRPASNSSLDMRYLAAYLHLPETVERMKVASTGTTMAILKIDAVANLEVRVPSKDEQARLAALFENALRHKRMCREMMKLSDMLIENEFMKSLETDETPREGK